MKTWVEHVKDCQKKMGLSYKEAMSNIDCRNAYKQMKGQKETPISSAKEAAYAKRRQRGMSVDRLKTPPTTIGERRMEEFRKILKVNRVKYAKKFGEEFVKEAAMTRGQAAEYRRKTKPPVPRKRMTDEEFDQSIAMAAKKLFEAAQRPKPKRTQPKVTPRGNKRVPKK